MNAVLYVLSRLLSLLSDGRARLVKYYITAQPVHKQPLTPPRRGRKINVSEVDAATALALPMNRPRDVIEYRLHHGGRCLAAYKDATFVGFQWFTLTSYPEDEVRCLFRLAPSDRCAWDYDIFVLPEWRAQPVFTRLWDTCNDLLRQANVDLSLSRIHAFNSESRRAHERIGAKIIGWAAFLCLGSLQCALFSARPWLAVSVRANATPILDVSHMARAAASRIFGMTA